MKAIGYGGRVGARETKLDWMAK